MTEDSLSATFAALADPTRRSILAQLARGAATVNELAAQRTVSLPAVSKHLKVLEKAGLIVKGREAQWRPCRLQTEPLREVDTWIETYRQFFEDRFDRLEEQLRSLKHSPRTPPEEPHGRHDPVSYTHLTLPTNSRV